jgi:exodeoxyribonuclease VII small subunit
MNDAEKEELTFEEALAQLDETVTRLEGGDLSLEESLALYERGQALVAFCNEQLEKATLRVEQLTTEGELKAVEID